VTSPVWVEPVRLALNRHGPRAFEIEQGDLLSAVWSLAEGTAASVAVAVTPRTFRREARNRPALARRPVCLRGLRASMARQPAGFGRAWVVSWLGVTKTADRDALGGALRARAPSLSELFDAALRCTCDAAACPARPGEPTGVVLISHALALDWMERGRANQVFVVEADRLPEAERSRAQISVWFDVLEERGIECGAVRETLLAFPAGALPLRQRLEGAWARVKCALGRGKGDRHWRGAALLSGKGVETARVLVPHPGEWRWLAAGAASPWFPQATVYRETAGHDWSAALARLQVDLTVAVAA
jgi:hypothetical protein